MIISIDTETQGLNTQKFLMGVICYKEKHETFRDKTLMWNRLMELAEQHRKKQECLLIYAHNMMYDFLAIRPQQLPEGMYQFCHNPFIVDMEDKEILKNGRPMIYCKFLSTTSLFHGSLEEIGSCLGNPKTETPEWLKQEEYEPNFVELLTAEKYMVQDAKIVMDFVLSTKQKLKEIGIQPRHLITAPQVGISYMLQQLSKSETGKKLFSNTFRREFWKSQYPDLINKSARAGRVECFALGYKEDATHIDVNSLWPHCLMNLRMPDLQTETLISEPLQHYSLDRLFSEIGISTCIIECPNTPYGVLPVRPKAEENYYPTTEQLIIGTWTHQELKLAMEEGYKILSVKESVIWREMENPFTEIVQNIYEKKKNATNAMDRYIWKMILNGGIGKFKQRRYYTDYKWLYPSEELEYIQKGYDCIEIWENKRLYAKKGDWLYPNYSAPILYSLVTADARIRMYKDFRRLPRNKVYYCDTDCIIADRQAIKNAKFKYSENIGDYKVEQDGVMFLCYGKKNYMIGNTIKASGVGRLWRTPEDFKKGYLTYKRMLTEHNTAETSLIGTFQTLQRDLWETMAKTEKQQQEEAENAYVVDNHHDITEFDGAISKWMASKEFTHLAQPDLEYSS